MEADPVCEDDVIFSDLDVSVDCSSCIFLPLIVCINKLNYQTITSIKRGDARRQAANGNLVLISFKSSTLGCSMLFSYTSVVSFKNMKMAINSIVFLGD